MNANELADELDYCYGKEYPCPVSKEAATMLRQQQAEIEALKAGKIRAYNNGVEDGRKPDTNNKPVAWIEPAVLPLTHIIKAVVRREQDEQYSIPLYTHPVEELTDAITLLEKYADKLEDERPNKGLSDVVLECVEILRKAQE